MNWSANNVHIKTFEFVQFLINSELLFWFVRDVDSNIIGFYVHQHHVKV